MHCSTRRLIFCLLLFILFYIAIIYYYLHNNLTIPSTIENKNDNNYKDKLQRDLEKLRQEMAREKEQRAEKNPDIPTTTKKELHHMTQVQPTPVPDDREKETKLTVVAKMHHVEEKEPQTEDYGEGYIVSDSDHKAHAHPGGSEEEANQDRRKLETHNKKFYETREFWKMWWRVADFDEDVKRNNEIPPALLKTQIHEKNENVNENSLLQSAIQDCNDPNLENFACLISSYDRRMMTKKKSRKCHSIYGSGLIERLQKNRYKMCEGITSNMMNKQSEISPSLSSSSLTCFSDRIHSDHTIDTSVCGGSNLALDFTKMEDGDFPWLSFQHGALTLSQCTISPSIKQNHWNFMHCLKDWMDLGFKLLSADEDDGNQDKFPCRLQNQNDDHDDDHFFVTRSGDYSPFALAHDWVNAVIVFAVGNISRHKSQIHIMERMTVGFYSPMWSLAFSPGKSIEWFPEFRKKKNVCFGARKQTTNKNNNVNEENRREKIWFNIPARLSPLYNSDDCGASPIIRFTSDLLVVSVGAHKVHSPNTHFVITLIVRRNYQTGHTIERRIPNWRNLVQGLKDHFISNNINGEKVIVHAIDYADFDFDQQLNISRATDLLVGMHGAGLIQSMFLPLHGGLFEFFCPDRPPGNNRYENLARRLGIKYASYNIEDSQNVVPVNAAVLEIEKLAKQVGDEKKKKNT